MEHQHLKFQLQLPARITGLVFWCLVFIGLLAAVFILQRAESDLVTENHEDTILISHEIKSIVERYSEVPVIKKAAGRIRSGIKQYMKQSNFHAVRLHEGDQLLSIGVINVDDESYESTLRYLPKNSTEQHEIELEVYSANPRDTVAELRKNILLSIGLSVFIFGLFLQRVLQKILSIPFQKMISTAEQFSQGNDEVRFDEKRQDEFGYLGKFINNAIDAILSNKNELMQALVRVSTSEIALGLEKERAEITLHSICDSVVTVDVEERIVYLNPAGEVLLGCSNEEVSGKKFNSVLSIVDEISGEPIDDPLHECFVTGNTVYLPQHASLEAVNDSLISIEASMAPMKTDNGTLMGAVIVIQDVSHTRRLTRQLSYQASHDLLTGLFNRRKFEECLEELLLHVAEEERFHSLFYLDLDNFKIVNDTCGHVAGDELLKQLPALFHDILRSGDIIARLGGDEFGVILENCALKQAVIIADKIRHKIKGYRFIWDGRSFEIGISIGVVGIDAQNCEMSQVLSSADVSCYAAKDAGRNSVHVFELSDEATSERYGQLHWTARILKAFEEDRFRLYQQPIVSVNSESIDHCEILLRMIDDDGEAIQPGSFMPAAERYGLMPDIDRWVIKEVFKFISNKPVTDIEDKQCMVYAINLSGDSINDRTFLEYIFKQKDLYSISLSNICFEITETVAISNLTKATVFINELKNHGCKFALDDFGSGLSSFAYLKTLPVSYLKIDGCFVKDICHDEIDRAMVESIQQVGNVMKLETIAEHVEDEATLSMLREIGIDYVQGYYLGEPIALA